MPCNQKIIGSILPKHASSDYLKIVPAVKDHWAFKNGPGCSNGYSCSKTAKLMSLIFYAHIARIFELKTQNCALLLYDDVIMKYLLKF